MVFFKILRLKKIMLKKITLFQKQEIKFQIKYLIT